MYYIYFFYVVILAALMGYECYHNHHPWWWALMVLAAPVTTPYFIFKSRRAAGGIPFIIFLSTFILVTGGEYFLYSADMDRYKQAQLMPVTRQMIHLGDALKTTTIKLDRELRRLENHTKIESRVNEINHTIEFIDELRDLLRMNQEAIKQFVTYASDHQKYLVENHLEWAETIRDFYTHNDVIQHDKSLQNYLDSFADVLKYTFVNFYHITAYKSIEHLKNYDAYYLRYRRAIDAHNRFNVKRIDFQNSILEKYPDLKPFLPGERQTDTFRLWE